MLTFHTQEMFLFKSNHTNVYKLITNTSKRKIGLLTFSRYVFRWCFDINYAKGQMLSYSYQWCGCCCKIGHMAMSTLLTSYSYSMQILAQLIIKALTILDKPAH